MVRRPWRWIHGQLAQGEQLGVKVKAVMKRRLIVMTLVEVRAWQYRGGLWFLVLLGRRHRPRGDVGKQEEEGCEFG